MSITSRINPPPEFYSSISYINIDLMLVTNEAFVVVKAVMSAKGKKVTM